MKFTQIHYVYSSSLLLLAALAVATFVSLATMMAPASSRYDDRRASAFTPESVSSDVGFSVVSAVDLRLPN